MMWAPATVTAAASEAVSVLDARRQCAIEDEETGFDPLLTRLIAAARDHVERYCGVRIGAQTLSMACDGWCDLERLPEAPVSSVTSVTYVDTDGATQTLSTSVYEVRTSGLDAGMVLKYGQAWPAMRPGSRITVVAEAGYATAPAALTHAMLLLIGHWYSNRESVITGTITAALPQAFDDLLSNFRRGA